jgi:hypothetical protein
MLALAENNLRSTRCAALLFFLVLHQVGSSHFLIAPAESFAKLAERRATRSGFLVLWWLERIMFRAWHGVKFGACCMCPKCNRLSGGFETAKE